MARMQEPKQARGESEKVLNFSRLQEEHAKVLICEKHPCKSCMQANYGTQKLNTCSAGHSTEQGKN